jgi:hypothetical protein
MRHGIIWTKTAVYRGSLPAWMIWVWERFGAKFTASYSYAEHCRRSNIDFK